MAAPPLPVQVGETCTSCDGITDERKIGVAEMELHRSEASCWVLLGGDVWDLTPFLADHPGGPGAILEFAGKDATAVWDSIHPPEVRKLLSPALKVGIADLELLAKVSMPGADASTSEQLLEACKKGGTMEVDALLALRADPNFRGGDGGEAPLHWAARKGLPEMVTALLAASATPEARDAAGQTPLHLAAGNGQREVIERLLAARAEANPTDRRGESPLHAAAATGSVRVVKLLLAGGADPALKDNEGDTAADTASNQGHSAVEELILVRLG